MDNAQRGKHSETLLSTISAFGEEAPDFEEAGVEIFQCGDIVDGPEEGAARVGTTRRMTIKIDGDTFEVVAYCRSA